MARELPLIILPENYYIIEGNGTGIEITKLPRLSTERDVFIVVYGYKLQRYSKFAKSCDRRHVFAC